MIRHIVMLNLLSDYDPTELSAVMDGLARLGEVLPGFVGFEHGPNRDFENKSADYPYVFMCTFESAADVEVYANDPKHQALGGRLVAMCNGGADGIMVVDIEV